MPNNETILNYEGPIEFEITEELLQKVKCDLEPHDIRKVLKKRVYNILVECIENILRHKAGDANTSVHPYIKLESDKDAYLITAGNLIEKDEVNDLKSKLDVVVLQNKEQLQKMYEEQINKEEIPTHNGAGLGILTIALKSNNKIDYGFKTIDNKYSVFELRVTIPVE